MPRQASEIRVNFNCPGGLSASGFGQAAGSADALRGLQLDDACQFDGKLYAQVMFLQNACVPYLFKFMVFSGFAAAIPAAASAQVYEIGTDGEAIEVSSNAALPAQDATSRFGATQTFSFSPAVTRKLMPANWKIIVTSVADQHGLDPILFEALIWQESRWNPSARSPKGAIGLTQLMPGTAQQLGVNPFDPVANMQGGARYLKSMLTQFDGNLDLALAAYNAGPMRISQYGGVPPFDETRNYVALIRQRISWGKALED
jgi:soluble lytic murein transglycosylase-like protein